MPLYLSPYIGAGIHDDPFRPTGQDQPGASAIDIRLDPTVQDGGGVGVALLWLPLGIPDPVGSVKIADDYGDLLTNQQRTRLNQRTGLDFGADTTIQDAVQTILLRGDIFGWKRLRPARGIYEAWLGSGTGKRDWCGLPAMGGGAISDNFNRANETPLASPWARTPSSTDTFNLSGNAVVKASGTNQTIYALSGYSWNDNQSAELLYASSTTNNDLGPAVRVSVAAFTAYFYSQADTFRGVWKVIAGAYTQVEATTGTPSVGETYKLDAAGSTLSYYNNGAEAASSPATDTSIAAGIPGIFYRYNAGSVDNFLATGEITVGSAPMFRGS